MFRGYMPALTIALFAAGIGIGLSWSLGWIPLGFMPVNSGQLGIEITQREQLPPPPDDDFVSPRSRRKTASAIVEEQTAGAERQAAPIQVPSSVVTADVSNDTPVALAVPAAASVDEPTDSPASIATSDSKEAESSAVARLRIRDRNPVRLDPNAGIEEAPAEEPNQRVTATAHQDPTEDSSPGRESAEANKSPQEILAAAEEKLAAGDTLVAHRDLSKLYWNNKEFRPKLQELIDSTAKAIFFTPKPHYIEPYVIQDGDRLQTVAKKYQLSWEYLAKLNRTDPRKIQVGQKLKVLKGPFGAVVDLRDFTLIIHLQGYYVKRYEVGIGKENSSPQGKFAVLNKLENPQYTDTRTGKVTEGNDPSNPLGKRWVDLGDGYGIHGTIDPDSIGKAESRGCIRLRDDDIIEVYNFLVKNSEVIIRK